MNLGVHHASQMVRAGALIVIVMCSKNIEYMDI